MKSNMIFMGIYLTVEKCNIVCVSNRNNILTTRTYSVCDFHISNVNGHLHPSLPDFNIPYAD